MIITNCPRCGAMNATTTCNKCGWSQFAISTVSTRITGEIEIMLSGKALLDDYKRLLLENRNLKECVAELEAAQRWRVVADGELPDDDVEVFVLLYGSSVSTGKHYRNARHLDLEDNSYNLNYVIGDYWLIGDDEITCAQHCYNVVTHWMPLPEPPEVQQ